MAALKGVVFLLLIPAAFCQYLSETCNDTSPCKIANSQCLEGRCSCLPGYSIDNTETKCLKVAVGYYDSCEDDTQCSEFLGVGGTCENNKCECGSTYHYLHGRCHKTHILNEYCKYNDECYVGSEYQAGSCKQGVCKCNDGFYQRESSACRRKVKNVGDECMLEQDCDFDDGTCVSHKCVLDKKPINAGLAGTVRRIMRKDKEMKIGSECTKNPNCQSVEHSICHVNGTCICERAHFPSDDMTGCIPEIGEACDNSKVDFQVEHSVCRENTWTCPIDKVAAKDNRRCIDLAEKIGRFCDVEEQCKLFGPRAECSAGRCWCNNASHYIRDERFCWINRKIGDKCSFNEECYSPGDDYKLLCQNDVCVCPDGWHGGEDKWYCLKNKAELGGDCDKDDDCGVQNSLCQSKKCACKEHYFELDGRCAAGLNAECKINGDCKSNNTVCHDSEKTCQCEPNFVSAPDTKCLPKSQYNGTCEHDVQCFIALPLTFCNITGGQPRCDCIEKTFYKENKCHLKKWVFDKCTASDECFTPNSHCEEGQCKCLPDYSFDEGKCSSSTVSRPLISVIVFILLGLKSLF